MRQVGRISYGVSLTLDSLARAFGLLVDEVRSAVNPITEKPIVNGVLVKGVQFTSATALQIPHGLGRKPLGYIVTRGYGAQPGVYDWFTTTTDHDDRFLYLACSVTCQADLWVF